jgi:hypothetical protein
MKINFQGMKLSQALNNLLTNSIQIIVQSETLNFILLILILLPS